MNTDSSMNVESNNNVNTVVGVGKIPTNLRTQLIRCGWMSYLKYMYTVTAFNSQFGSRIKNQFGLLFCNPLHPILRGVECKEMSSDTPLLSSFNDETPRVIVYRTQFNPLDYDGLKIVVNNAFMDGLEFLKHYPNIAVLFTNVELG
jgi:hypothetical protein